MRRLPPLASLRAFEAAARQMSFKKAAEELTVTPTAISHQIRLLEETLGLRLFERRTRQVVLTEAGQQLFPALRDGLDLMADAIERTAKERDRPSVVITTTTAFAAHWLVPRLSGFRERHPRIALSLLASDDVISLEGGKADLALRLADGPPPGLAATALFRDRFTPLASPALAIAEPADLERTALIQFDWHHPMPEKPTWSTWLAAAGLQRLRLAPQLRFNEESHALQAAIAAQGVALFSLTIASDALRRGLLVRPFETTIAGQTCYLLRRRQPGTNRSIEAVSAWLLEQAADADSFAADSRSSGIA